MFRGNQSAPFPFVKSVGSRISIGIQDNSRSCLVLKEDRGSRFSAFINGERFNLAFANEMRFFPDESREAGGERKVSAQ